MSTVISDSRCVSSDRPLESCAAIRLQDSVPESQAAPWDDGRITPGTRFTGRHEWHSRGMPAATLAERERGQWLDHRAGAELVAPRAPGALFRREAGLLGV